MLYCLPIKMEALMIQSLPCCTIFKSEEFKNSSENLEFPYWKYASFDLDSMTDDECKAEFRFFKNDIYLLGEVLDIPDIMKCPNGVLITHFQKVIQP